MSTIPQKCDAECQTDAADDPIAFFAASAETLPMALKISEPPPWTRIILSGAGINGLVFVGALFALNQRYPNYVHYITEAVGSSIGAIFAYLIADDRCMDEIVALALKFPFQEIAKNSNFKTLVQSYGFVRTESLFPLLFQVAQNRDETFAEFYERTHRNVHIVVTNVSKKKSEVHNAQNTPNFKILSSIMASMAMPAIFTPVFYENSLYVDGGVTENFPINLFPLEKTLGIRVCWEDAVYNMTPDQMNFMVFFNRILEVGLEHHVDEFLAKISTEWVQKNVLVIRIPNAHSTIAFNLTLPDRLYKLELGMKQCSKFLVAQWPPSLE